MKEITYSFKEAEKCCFCGAEKQAFKVLGKRMNVPQGYSPNKKIGISTTIIKCKNCGLIFSNPMPIPEKISDHYGIPAEDYWKPEYFIIPEGYSHNLIQWLEKLYPPKENTKILDIGAGIGKLMVAFQRNNYDVYGLEPSEPFYKKAIEKTGISSEKLILTTIEDYEFEPEQFDVIILAAVLEHLYYPNDVIKKLMVGLKPGGLIFIEVPHSKWLISRILNAFYKIKGLDYVTNLSPMHSPFHLFEFSLQSFEQNAKINNYEILDYTYYVCDTFMPKILNPLLIPFMKYTKTGMELAIWLRKPSG